MRKSISLLLILCVFVTNCVFAYDRIPPTIKEGIDISNYSRVDYGKTVYESFDANIDGEIISYNKRTDMNRVVLTFIEDGKPNKLIIDNNTGIVEFNGKSTHINTIVTEEPKEGEREVVSSIYSDERFSNPYTAMNSMNYNGLSDPTTLTYIEGAPVKCIIDVGQLIAIGLVTGAALFGWIATSIGVAAGATGAIITAKGVTVIKVSTALSYLCGLSTVLLPEWKIYYLKKQDYSTKSAKLEVTGPFSTVFRQRVRLYQDSNYSIPTSDWMEASYFQ